MKHFILATAGHVDHGKSALVKALTGTDPDRLPEEKAREISIELGFAQLKLAAPPSTIAVGVVDVPGHEDFVKNMVAGVGSIDLALLVVAADDGWMPQTEEHLQILNYLGVKHAVIALTKIDLAKSEDAAEHDLRAQLAGTPFHDAAIVRTSVTTNRGIEELKARLAGEFALLAPQPDIGKPRLAVDRAFTLRGIGAVVTGTLTGGAFQRAGAVVVQPANIPARIRAIQSHNRELEEIGPGVRTALNLPGMPIARDKAERGIWRGDVITLAGFGDANGVIDVVLTRSGRSATKTHSLKHGALVRVHHGSGNYVARVRLQSGEELPAGETGIAQLRFESPVFMFAGDRFVVRDSSGRSTVAGGVVLDPDASATNFRSAAQRKFLTERAQFPESVAVFVGTQLARDRAARRAALLMKSQFSSAQISTAISELSKSGNVIERGDLVIDAKWWLDLCERAVSVIDDEHRANPNRIGLELARLRSALRSEMPLPDVFDRVISELCGSGFIRAGEAIQRATHRPTLPPPLQAAGSRIRSALAAKPFDPPSRKELAPDSISQQTLRFLRDTGEVVEISAEVFLSSEAFANMREAVIKFIRTKGPANVSDLRQALGSSRRVVVPLLEYFDREGVTRRLGDKRTLAP